MASNFDPRIRPRDNNSPRSDFDPRMRPAGPQANRRQAAPRVKRGPQDPPQQGRSIGDPTEARKNALLKRMK